MTREEAITILKDCELNPCVPKDKEAANMAIKALEQEPKTEQRCKWVRYDYRTICPQNHDIDNPYWRIPEKRMEVLKYCPYCGKEIEVEE